MAHVARQQCQTLTHVEHCRCCTRWSQVVDAGAVPLLVLCVQEPELSLKRIAASSLSDIAKHTPELAQAVVDAGAVAYLAPLVINQDAKLKRQVCCAVAAPFQDCVCGRPTSSMLHNASASRHGRMWPNVFIGMVVFNTTFQHTP